MASSGVLNHKRMHRHTQRRTQDLAAGQVTRWRSHSSISAQYGGGSSWTGALHFPQPPAPSLSLSFSLYQCQKGLISFSNTHCLVWNKSLISCHVPPADGSRGRRTLSWLPLEWKLRDLPALTVRIIRAHTRNTRTHVHPRTSAHWCRLLDCALSLTMKLAHLISVLPCLAIEPALCVWMCTRMWERDRHARKTKA